MLAVERRNHIEQMINENGSVLVIDLAKQFEVTTETIRNDLLKLEKQGVLIRTYGGATLVENADYTKRRNSLFGCQYFCVAFGKIY